MLTENDKLHLPTLERVLSELAHVKTKQVGRYFAGFEEACREAMRTIEKLRYDAIADKFMKEGKHP